MTNTEIATSDDPRDAGTLEVFPPRQGAPAITGVTLREHVNSLKEAHYFADAICRTSMCPDIYRNRPQEATAVILYGHELGLSPMAALQVVINVHGKPGLEARTMKALLKSRGFKFRVTERSATRFRIEAWEPGSSKSDPPDEVSEWTMERAVLAQFAPRPDPTTKSGYKEFNKKSGGTAVDGNMKYITQPTEMLEAKGTAEVCRAIAPEILLGLPLATDEFDDIRDRDADDDLDGDRDDDAPKARRGRGTAGLKDRARKSKGNAADAEPAQEPMDADEVPVPDQADVESAIDNGDVPVVVADDPEPVVPDQPAADPSPAPPAADPTPEPAPEPEPEPADEAQAEPAPAAAPAEDMAMTPEVRAKGVDMLRALIINADVADADRAGFLSEVAAKRPDAPYRAIADVDDTTNTELKFLVDTLRAWKTQGVLVEWSVEAVNNAALREVGALPE